MSFLPTAGVPLGEDSGRGLDRSLLGTFEPLAKPRVEEAWISELLILGEAYPERALGIILGIEGGAGALLALGLWTLASLLAGLLYGLRYAIAPDGLALWVALVAAAVCVSDSGKSLRLFSLRQRSGENAPQTNSL